MEHQDGSFESNLREVSGIERPLSFNHDSITRFKTNKRQKLSLNEYLDGILGGNRTILSRAITLVESSLGQDQELARAIIENCLAASGKSTRIGITGVSGVGKSCFIDAF